MSKSKLTFRHEHWPESGSGSWQVVSIGGRERKNWPLCPVRRDGVGPLCALIYAHDGEHVWETN